MRAPTAAAAESAVEFFPSLTELSVVRHGFVGRVPGIDVATDRAEALNRLDAAHRIFRANLGFAADSFATAEQIHGGEVAVIDQPLSGERCFDGADGLITNQAGVSLGIYVADCCAIFLVDPVRHCLGLVHSGRKGTELAIVERAIGTMHEQFGSVPQRSCCPAQSLHSSAALRGRFRRRDRQPGARIRRATGARQRPLHGLRFVSLLFLPGGESPHRPDARAARAEVACFRIGALCPALLSIGQ